MAAFYGRVDAVAFLLELGSAGYSAAGGNSARGSKHKMDCILAKDVNGDSALHAATLSGNLQCVELLLYFIRGSANKQGLSPQAIAAKMVPPAESDEAGLGLLSSCTIGNSAFDGSRSTFVSGPGNKRLVHLICSIEARFRGGENALSIYGCPFDHYSAIVQYYGGRWVKCYDASLECYYYYDYCATGEEWLPYSTWERPDTFDMAAVDEYRYERAAEALKGFYTRYNPQKLWDVDAILLTYKGKYSELFLQLATRYQADIAADGYGCGILGIDFDGLPNAGR